MAKVKEILIKHDISSQVIFNQNLAREDFNLYLPNIEIALLAKLGGVPWRLNCSTVNELIVGVGAFYSHSNKTKYVGSAFCFNNEGIFALFTYLIFIPIVCVSFAAKPIFNLFLQLNPKNKLSIDNSISIQGIIFGNYIASLVITIIGFAYSLSCLAIISNDRSVMATVSCMLAIIAGVFISIVTFLPTIDLKRLRSVSFIYPLVVGGVGLFTIGLYLSTNQVGFFAKVFSWLVLLSPALAIYSYKYAQR